MLFVCPKCKRVLYRDGVRAVCESGHSFDVSKEGYVNLLIGRGGLHGDNAEMVIARKNFLEGGYYEPLARRISELVAELARSGLAVVDAGCGEGYYTELVNKRLNESRLLSGGSVPLFGFDISKDAVKRAAKRRSGEGFAVASSYDMPFSDGSVGLIYNIFSPLATDEVRRTLAQGGIFIMVIAGEEHLFSLKAAIYDTPYKNKLDSKELSGFSLLSEEQIRIPIELKRSEDIKNLFMMTPYAYRTSREGRERVSSLNALSTEAHFYILVYRKN